MATQDEDLKVAVSQLQRLININGATDVRVEGFLFERSSSGGADGYVFCGQTAVRVASSQNIVISDSKFRQTGMNGVCVTESSDVRVTRSVFNDIGYHGVTSLYNSGWKFNILFALTLGNFWEPF